MSPKAFPFPIGVGSDICSMSRIGNLIREPTRFNLFARRLFTRLEWPFLLRKIEKTGVESIAENHDYKQRRINKLAILHLPKISRSALVGSERSPDGELVRFLAGRWAAKEAAIKAHRRRRLLMSDISITAPEGEKASILIDPPRHDIVMEEGIARLRGLRGLYGNTAETPQTPLSQYCYGNLAGGKFFESKHRTAYKFFKRRARVADEDRQLADLSISHDGEYAIAVCIALDEEVDNAQGKPVIVDDGSGGPLHEPEWADEGWFSPADGRVEDVGRDDQEVGFLDELSEAGKDGPST